MGTAVADRGLPWRCTLDGRPYVIQRSITTDFALVRALRGDRLGNLCFKKAARNFNPLCAMVGRLTIVEVQELVEPGKLDPGAVRLPGIFVQRVVQADRHQAKQIEKRTVRPRPETNHAFP